MTGTAAPQTRRGGRGKDLRAWLWEWFRMRDHRLSLASAILIVLLVVYTGAVMRANTTRNVDFALIREKMSAAAASMEAGDAKTLSRHVGLESETVDDWLYYLQPSTMDVTELLIVASSKAAALDEAEKTVNAHLAEQINNFEQYGTNQSFLLNHAIVWRRGNYLFFGVGEDVDKWQDEFLSCVR